VAKRIGLKPGAICGIFKVDFGQDIQAVLEWVSGQILRKSWILSHEISGTPII